VSYVRWSAAGWSGWRADDGAVDVDACLAADARADGRRSRHARTQGVQTAAGTIFVKSYPPPGASRARRAFAMGRALAAAGFAAPRALLVGSRAGAGLLVTGDTGGDDLLVAMARLAAGDSSRRRTKRALLHTLGAEVARLHRAGFVHGDLVPPNLRWRDGELVFLDNDRTRRGRLPLLARGARRNLVQLGRFVIPGVSVTDRARVLRAYATARGFGRRQRHRLGTWVMRKITARRCAIDHICPDVAARAGFRTLMRSGGPFDPGT
jgi:lipopolysaccharide kinase (Kdo/WaaP) family protein